MSLYPNSIRDERVREYLLPTRILKSEKTDNPENLLKDRGVQVYLYHFNSRSDGCIIQPGGMILADFGIELHGGVRINIYGLEGNIRLRFGESVSEAINNPNQNHAIHDVELPLPNHGMMEFGNTGFRFVSIVNTGEKPLTLFSLHAVAIYRDMEMTGSFESSDERLNKIWQTAAYTLQLNLQDYIYDGIKRDRLVWMGDMHPEVRGMLAAFKDLSLVEKSLDFMRTTTDHQFGMNSCWSYSIWYLICLHDYYMATGCHDFLLRQKDCVLLMLDYLVHFVDDNGIEKIPETRFLDWPTRENEPAKHAGLQGLLLWAMNIMTKLLTFYGIDPAPAIIAGEKLKRHIPDCHGLKTPAALQTLSGLADRRDILETDPMNGISTFFGFYILLAKETKPALELIRRYWGTMLDFGATTFWEDFDLKWTENACRIDELPVPGKDDLHADFGAYCYKGLRHSLCHGWSCGPLPFMSERLLGIRFIEPGGRKVAVNPQDGGLEYLKGSYPTPFGNITVEKIADNRWRIDAPNGVDVISDCK